MKIGDRVALAPYLDLWAKGARYGNVMRMGLRVHQDLRSNEIVSERYAKVKIDGYRYLRTILVKDLEVVQ